MKTNRPFGFSAFLVVLAMAPPVFAYEYPLTLEAIREAYFLGSGQKSKNADFYSQYSHSLGDAKADPPGSINTIDTPYLQIAEHSRDTSNYHAQDAEKDFFQKPAEFHVFLNIYFKPVEADDSNTGKSASDGADSKKGMRVKLMQHKKEIACRTVESYPLYPFHNASTLAEHDGEYAEISCDAAKIDSSVLIVTVETPDSQQVETEFDLAEIK